MKDKIAEFVKKEMVLCVALVLAVISAFWIPPDGEYFSYIDFRTLAILFCLMGVMAGFQHIGMFQWVAGKLLKRVHSPKGIIILLVLLCFFFSMLITNDVALITFVPFTFVVYRMLGERLYRKMVLPTVVLQTVAANLGSMLTPIGNPQNLYLYGSLNKGPVEFMRIMLPYSLLSLLLLVLCCLVLGQKASCGIHPMDTEEPVLGKQDSSPGEHKGAFLIYMMLFGMCLLTVAHVIPVWLSFLAVILGLAATAYKELAHIDYALLMTFVAFFVFIGNMSRIPAFAEFLQGMIAGNETFVAILASQCISNVPAALLLSGFTTDIPALIVGTNLGGLGTLIASMASLISYKYIAAECDGREIPGGKGRYLLEFSVVNVCFLVILVVLYLCI